MNIFLFWNYLVIKQCLQMYKLRSHVYMYHFNSTRNWRIQTQVNDLTFLTDWTNEALHAVLNSERLI